MSSYTTGLAAVRPTLYSRHSAPVLMFQRRLCVSLSEKQHSRGTAIPFVPWFTYRTLLPAGDVLRSRTLMSISASQQHSYPQGSPGRDRVVCRELRCATLSVRVSTIAPIN
jgi:hypothetical protein